jgi:outer membrane lipoprotein SlyB
MGYPHVGGSFGGNLMTVLGVVIGALTGNRFEEAATSTALHLVTVQFDDGSSRVLTSAGTPAWAPGDRVKVINGRILSNAGGHGIKNAALGLQ